MNKQAYFDKDSIFNGSHLDDEAKGIDILLQDEISKNNDKIIVLDDDPTGVQTVHNVSVFTDWSEESIRNGFKEKNKMFFILTNSRGFSEKETIKAHSEIGKIIEEVAMKENKSYQIISRSDSTLRGHYPLETETIRKAIEENTNIIIDGEIIIPFFKEGGRFTINDVHWIEDNGRLIPSGETEFAKDTTFGYKNSNLKLWVEEKTLGRYKSDDIISISLDMIRNQGYNEIAKVLVGAKQFQKIIVNAFDYPDLIIFTIGLILAEQQGKKFLYRTAASFVKVRGGVSDREFLTKEELVKYNNKGGLIIVGSHVERTTRQLNTAMELEHLKTVELSVPKVISNEAEDEISRVSNMVENEISNGNTILVYTSRSVVKVSQKVSEKNLEVSIKVSEALVNIVKSLNIAPSFIIVKGGITSSDIGTKGLGVKRALVAGQIKPGIPVWITDKESKFSEIPYIIFPGNVGNDDTLKEIIDELQ